MNLKRTDKIEKNLVTGGKIKGSWRKVGKKGEGHYLEGKQNL